MDKKPGWKRFQRLSFDRKSLSKQALKAEALTKRHAHKFVIGRLRTLRDVRQQIASWMLIVGVLIGAVALQLSWYQVGYSKRVGVPGGTYAEAVSGPIETLNPLFASTSAEQSAAYLLFSRLFDYDPTGHLRNDVAKSVEIDSTQKLYTVTLRNDVLWHDETKLTADDIVFTVDLMKNPQVRAAQFASWQGIGIKKINELTVQFSVPAPYSTFPHALSFAILPKHILESVQPTTLRENSFSVTPIGSGPFKLRLLQTIPTIKDRQKIAHLLSWGKYYRGAPKLAHFELHAYNDQSSLARALASGDVNAAAGLAYSDDIPKTAVTENIPLNSGAYALLNMKSPILTDAAVRQALQRGTDTTLLRKKTGLPDFPLDLPFIPSQIQTTTTPAKAPYNLAEANAILENGGWKLQGKARVKAGLVLKLRVVAAKDTRYKAVADELIRQWKQLGIQVESTEFDPLQNQQSFAQAVLQPRSYDILINELVIGGDSDVFAYWHSSQAQSTGYNFSNYQNGLVDDTLSSARSSTDPSLRARKYTVFGEQWLKDVPAIGLFRSSLRYAHTKTVASVVKTNTVPTPVDRYSNILYWTAERGQVYKTQ